MALLNDSQPKHSSSPASTDASVPSGFILKLYQMVNGAPDDVISWTSSGDAFKIGSELKKLESETLPQYFRHSRFQSLVRQLNFYNFRKVNRERTFWIYKHELFHRDRPENLHLLRRRTCPGVDGRKNRYGITEASVITQSSRSASSDDSDGDFDGEEGKTRKRRAVVTATDSKRACRESGRDFIVGDALNESQVSSKRISGRRLAHRDAESVELKLDSSEKEVDRCERIQQSFVVSQVSMKLEEYARKARKPALTSINRTRPGVVTPPTSSAFVYLAADSRGLLTYDDEFEDEKTPKRVSRGSSVTSPDGEDSLSSEDEREANIVSESDSPVKARFHAPQCSSPPIEDLDTVKVVVQKLLGDGSSGNSNQASASAAVIGFCMSNAPSVKEGLFNKILQLVLSSEYLAFEFQQYRAALHPIECSSDKLPSFMYATGYRNCQDMSSPQGFHRAVDRVDVVRDFTTFAVNLFRATLLQKSSKLAFTKSEGTALRYTADVWLKSACARA